ncbi:uridine kinase [Phycicoccus sonneratiae]|uniref:Uridine kinase n=1 Tax=Phycicoccus sonneratiae TaxID=2807628 RepID=A0ABS2CKN0_9MICO|nr:uridine kinase [Phycicoccus sonneraticus]MBM6400388.1 uridine kinase [Phycicoccus sonneraticus]
MTTGRLDAFDPPSPTGRRAEVLGRLADLLLAVRPGERAVVAVDGVDGAGKTVLARELALLLATRREVHRAGVDGFHRPRDQRYARGRTAESFYRDSYDLTALREHLVDPFRAGRPFRPAVHDVGTDAAVDVEAGPAGPEGLLLLDGIFLHRPGPADLWDASVFVDVPFEVSVPRGNARFGPLDAERSDPGSSVNARYVGGQRLYLAEADPATRATWVLDNADLAAPVLTRRGARGGGTPTATG